MKRLLFSAAASLLLSATATAALTGPILSNGAAATPAQDDANKDLVMKFMRDFFRHGELTTEQAASTYLARDFQNHDPDEPSGAANFAAFVSRRNNNGPSASTSPEPLRLLVMTEGNLTLFAYPSRGGDDPAASFGSNLFSHKDGKLTGWWYSGPVGQQAMPAGMQAGAAPDGMAAGAPAMPGAPATMPDYSKLYQGYTASTGAKVVMSNGSATPAQRTANKKLALAFIDEFFVQKQTAAASKKYLSNDLKNHSKDQPSGTAFATFAAANSDKVTAPDPSQTLFTIADGELVAVAYPFPVNGDPGGHYSLNLLRINNGKIVEWWYSGLPSAYTGTPAGGAPNGKYVPVP